MSLLSSAMEDCTMLDRLTINDGYGGYMSRWSEGATISAAIVLDSSIEALTAQAMGVTGVYTITTKRNINLQYHDVLKRKSDNKIFRVTSDGDDKKTPPSAGLDMRQVSAEEWSLPNDQTTSS